MTHRRSPPYLVVLTTALLAALSFACNERVHVTTTLEVVVQDPSGAPVPMTGVSFRSIKFVNGAELARSEFMFSRSTSAEGFTSFTVGYNVDSSEDILLEAWTGDASNLDSELIPGSEVLSLAAADTDFTAITRRVVLTECPMDAPSLCDGACVDTRNDRLNCGGCGVMCPVDCLDRQCIPCSNGDGAWSLGGDCPVSSCVVDQSACGGSITCIDSSGMATTPTPINLTDGMATFSASGGDCAIRLDGDSMSGSCSAVIFSCDVTGTRTR